MGRDGGPRSWGRPPAWGRARPDSGYHPPPPTQGFPPVGDDPIYHRPIARDGAVRDRPRMRRPPPEPPPVRSRPRRIPPTRQYPVPGPRADDGYRGRGRVAAPPGPPPGAPWPPAGDPYGRGEPPELSGPPRARPNWGRRVVLFLVLVAILGVVAGAYVDSHLTRTEALVDYDDRPSTSGTNWLIVGSDSRANLSGEQEDELSTGRAAGARTDTIMLLHTGSAGTTLISLPRDSLLSIPGHGRNKLNAAFSLGGPALLVKTVEQATGLEIDDYAEIGFDGFVNVVDAVGGVEMCIPEAMKDPKAGLNLKPGCQTLEGAAALGYVRTRATPRADLDRVAHQREFLSALMKRILSPATFLNPFRMVGLVNALPAAVTVDQSDHVWHLARLALAMRELSGGSGLTTTVPIGGFGSFGGSSVVKWDTTRAKALFGALADDEAPPKSSIN